MVEQVINMKMAKRTAILSSAVITRSLLEYQNHHVFFPYSPTQIFECKIVTKGGIIRVHQSVLEKNQCVMDVQHGWKEARRTEGEMEIVEMTLVKMDTNLLDMVAVVFMMYGGQPAVPEAEAFPTCNSRDEWLKRLLETMKDMGMLLHEDDTVEVASSTPKQQHQGLFVRVVLRSGHHALVNTEGRAYVINSKVTSRVVTRTDPSALARRFHFVQLWICCDCNGAQLEQASVDDHQKENHDGKCVSAFMINVPQSEIQKCNKCGKKYLEMTALNVHQGEKKCGASRRVSKGRRR